MAPLDVSLGELVIWRLKAARKSGSSVSFDPTHEPLDYLTHGDVPMAVQAMKEGAFEFIQKPFRDQDLLDRINHALKQDADDRSSAARRSKVQHRLASLTPRERQVMSLIVDGTANKVIAIDLELSERTVDIHRAKVMEKMGARSVAHLVKLYLTLADEPATQLLQKHCGKPPLRTAPASRIVSASHWR